jgi:murein DD-endopeptidase MepM/ murein hydrolase activator NlpD
VSVSDITSGIASTEYSADGGAWANYTTPVIFSDGIHKIQFRTSDTAGLFSETEIFDFKIDSSAPEIHLPSRWYIWESGTFTVKDAGSKIISLSYQIRDSQNRWKKIERSWTPDTRSFTHTISWNRVFADGITAPVGTYNVIIYAENEAGNRSQKSAQIIIPQPNATALPTFTPTLTATNTPLTTPTATAYDAPPIVPTATQTPFVFLAPEPRATEEKSGFFSFFNPPNNPNRASRSTSPSSPIPSTGSGNILWGATAAAALGAFNAVIAEKKRKEAEARERRAQHNNSDHAKRRVAEKAGTLGAYIREIRKERATQAKAKVASILHRDQKKKDEKQREKSRLSDKEWKKKQARQARWDANGAAIYEQKKVKTQKEAERVAARQNLHENSLSHKISIGELDLKNLPKEEKIAGRKVNARILPPPLLEKKPFDPLTDREFRLEEIIQARKAEEITYRLSQPHYIVDNIDNGGNVNFRDKPGLGSNIIAELTCGTAIELTGGEVKDGKFIWKAATVIGKSIQGWVAEPFLTLEDPFCSVSPKYGRYPGAGETVMLTRLPYNYIGAKETLPFWWGFGNNEFARRPGNYKTYAGTGGLHSGIDFGIPYGTELVWAGNKEGVVIDVNSSKYHYMGDKNTIVIEAGGFHFIYGHTSSAIVKEGDIVILGQTIGYSGGTEETGNPHLHFEIRPVPSEDREKSKYYINPLTFYDGELQTDLYNYFTGTDYLPGEDSLSLGYYH